MGIRKKRKQPPKRSMAQGGSSNPDVPTTRRRGRPSKKKPTDEPAEAEVKEEETSIRDSGSSPEKTLNCSICLDTSRCRKMKVLPCGHSFHERCVNRWLELDVKCPLCRTWFLDLSNF